MGNSRLLRQLRCVHIVVVINVHERLLWIRKRHQEYGATRILSGCSECGEHVIAATERIFVFREILEIHDLKLILHHTTQTLFTNFWDTTSLLVPPSDSEGTV